MNPENMIAIKWVLLRLIYGWAALSVMILLLGSWGMAQEPYTDEQRAAQRDAVQADTKLRAINERRINRPSLDQRDVLRMNFLEANPQNLAKALALAKDEGIPLRQACDRLLDPKAGWGK
jgi:hypothetical protein